MRVCILTILSLVALSFAASHENVLIHKRQFGSNPFKTFFPPTSTISSSSSTSSSNTPTQSPSTSPIPTTKPTSSSPLQSSPSSSSHSTTAVSSPSHSTHSTIPSSSSSSSTPAPPSSSTSTTLTSSSTSTPPSSSSSPSSSSTTVPSSSSSSKTASSTLHSTTDGRTTVIPPPSSSTYSFVSSSPGSFNTSVVSPLPSSADSDLAAKNGGFMHNVGAAVPTFIVIALVCIALLAGLFLYLRKRRRDAREAEEDAYFEKYGHEEPAYDNDRGDLAADDDAGMGMAEVVPAQANAYPDRSMHYGDSGMGPNGYYAPSQPQPPQLVYSPHGQVNDYRTFAVDYPPNMAGPSMSEHPYAYSMNTPAITLTQPDYPPLPSSHGHSISDDSSYGALGQDGLRHGT